MQQWALAPRAASGEVQSCFLHRSRTAVHTARWWHIVKPWLLLQQVPSGMQLSIFWLLWTRAPIILWLLFAKQWLLARQLHVCTWGWACMTLNCDFTHSFKIVVLQDSSMPWLVLECVWLFSLCQCAKFLVRHPLVRRLVRFICTSRHSNFCNWSLSRAFFSIISWHFFPCTWAASARVCAMFYQVSKVVLSFSLCRFLFKLPLLVDFVLFDPALWDVPSIRFLFYVRRGYFL